MRYLTIFIAVIMFCFLSCRENEKQLLTVQSEKILDSIPSGSGLAVKKDSAYIISDDGTGIYQISLRDYHQTKIAIAGLPFNEYREPKPVKHDFESACIINWKGSEYLLAFGSGSNSTSRDSMLMINTSAFNDQKIFSLHGFYQKIQRLTRTDSAQWNIEGAATVKDWLFICNRGDNQMFTCKLNAFLSWLLGEPNSHFPGITFGKITLPSIGNREARLSGLCTLDQTRLLFTASVEDTPDWTKDGPVLGSYIGIYSIEEKKPLAVYLLRDKKGETLKEKIESLDILKREPGNGFVLLAIGDNDNGTSRLLQLHLQQ